MHSPQTRQRHSGAFASYSHSSGSALRRGDHQNSGPVHFCTGVDECSPATNAMTTLPWTKQPDGTWPRKASPTTGIPHMRTTSIGQGDYYAGARASAGPSLVPSSLSTGPSKTSLPQKTGLRATLRRMFSSKKGRSSLGETRYNCHQSDPGNLTSITEGTTDTAVAQLPSRVIGDATQTSALHSHNPNAEQLPRPSAGCNQPRIARRRRRNTVPSLILTEQEAQALAGP